MIDVKKTLQYNIPHPPHQHKQVWYSRNKEWRKTRPRMRVFRQIFNPAQLPMKIT